jgi:hypothetical protein
LKQLARKRNREDLADIERTIVVMDALVAAIAITATILIIVAIDPETAQQAMSIEVAVIIVIAITVISEVVVVAHRSATNIVGTPEAALRLVPSNAIVNPEAVHPQMTASTDVKLTPESAVTLLIVATITVVAVHVRHPEIKFYQAFCRSV